MTQASAGQSSDRRQRVRRWLWNLMYVLIGGVAASVWWIRIYDPSLLNLWGTVEHPVRPPDPKPGTLVVDPLSQTWDFDGEKIPWEPVLALAQISESAYQQGSELDRLSRISTEKICAGFPIL